MCLLLIVLYKSFNKYTLLTGPIKFIYIKDCVKSTHHVQTVRRPVASFSLFAFWDWRLFYTRKFLAKIPRIQLEWHSFLEQSEHQTDAFLRARHPRCAVLEKASSRPHQAFERASSSSVWKSRRQRQFHDREPDTPLVKHVLSSNMDNGQQVDLGREKETGMGAVKHDNSEAQGQRDGRKLLSDKLLSLF